MRRSNEFDYTKQAADHLREVSKRSGIDIGSGHAHMLVAAAFGYGSRKAMQDDPDGPYIGDQWLSERADNVGKIKDAIARMNDAPVQLDQASMIAALIQEGLTPVCVKCGRLSSQNMAVGDVRPGDEANWICRTCASDNSQYGHCRCCGENLLFSVDELDDQGLCQEHAGEFDLSPEEEEDWESYIENVQKGD